MQTLAKILKMLMICIIQINLLLLPSVLLRIILAAIIAAMCLASCSGPEYRRELKEADSIASVDSERAMTMLDSMRPVMTDAPEHELMYYRLLRIKASDKAYIEHETDTVILPLVEYYETKGDKRLLSEAYYYAGNTYRDMNDAPRALEYYQKAINVLPDYDIKFRSSLCFRMARIFLNQALYRQAIEMYKKTYECDKRLNDSVRIIYTLCDLAYTYNKIPENDSSIYYYDKAYRLAKQINNDNAKINVLGQMASFYIDKGDYEKAKECLTPALQIDDSPNLSPDYAMALKICMGTGQYDSAYFYGKELLNIGTIYAKQTASRCLTELYMMRKDYGNALKHLKLFNEYTDSVKNITATESVSRMNSLYNYNLREKENLMLKAENSRNLSIIAIVTAVCCVVLSVFVTYIYRNRQRQKVQAENVKRLKRELFEQSEEYIQRNKEKIEFLEAELKKASEENNALISRMEEQRADLIFANEAAERKKTRNEAARARLAETEICRTIQNHIKRNKIITNSEWEILDRIVNQEIENFRTNLYGYYSISEHEYHICLLIRIGISPEDMANLLGCTTSAVSKARKRLQEKFFSDSGTAKDFDAFVNSL